MSENLLRRLHKYNFSKYPIKSVRDRIFAGETPVKKLQTKTRSIQSDWNYVSQELYDGITTGNLDGDLYEKLDDREKQMVYNLIEDKTIDLIDSNGVNHGTITYNDYLVSQGKKPIGNYYGIMGSKPNIEMTQVNPVTQLQKIENPIKGLAVREEAKATPSTEVSTPTAKLTTATPVSTEGGVITNASKSIDNIVNGTGTNADYDLFKVGQAENRKAFEDATGIKLPATNSETRKFLRDFANKTPVERMLSDIPEAQRSSIIETANKIAEGTEKTSEQLVAEVKGISDNITATIKNQFGIDVDNGRLLEINLKALADNPETIITPDFVKGYSEVIGEKLTGINPKTLENYYFGKAPLGGKLADYGNKFKTVVDNSAQTLKAEYEGIKNIAVQNNSDVPTFEDFKETVLNQYPKMPDELIREGYNGLYGLTDETGNDIINTNDVYYQRRETDGPQGRYNGNGNEQSGDYIESADTVRTEGYKFRDGRDYRSGRSGLWNKIHGRVSGTLKKTSPKYIRHGNRAIMFSEYDNARSVKQFFKDVYNRDVIICKDNIIERDFGSKGMPEFNASAAYVQGKILVTLGRDSETSFVHELIHEGQNDIMYENTVREVSELVDGNGLKKLISEKKAGYGGTYENRINFDDDIGYETYADIISRLATKEWREYGSRSELFADEASYNRAKEIAQDYVVYLINNPPQTKVDTIIKDVSELGNDFADDYMYEKSESNPYFALKESDAEKALAYMEQNYGEMYRGLIDRYKTIKPGEIPQVEDVKVPKKTGKRQYVSNYARTMAETRVFSEAMQGEFEKMVVDGNFSHERISNKKAERKATKEIQDDGFKNSVNKFSVLVEEGKFDKNTIAKGQLLLNIACQNRDVDMAKKLAVDLSMAATQAGQTVQAFSMLKRMSPDGQLYYLEKTVQKINDDIVNKYKGKYSKVEIDSKLAEDLLNAKNQDEINEAVYAIEKSIGEQMPASNMDKWNAWRYLAMLGNTRTHFRNLFGNMGFVPARKIKDMIGATIEKAVLPKSERTKSYTKTKESKDFAKQDFNKMSEIIKGNEGKYGTQRGIEEHRKIFETKWLEAVRKFNTDALEFEDGIFLELAYKDAFAQAMTARGLSADYLNSGTKEANADLQKIREYAINEAQKATYRDANAHGGDKPNGIKVPKASKEFKRNSKTYILTAEQCADLQNMYNTAYVDKVTPILNNKNLSNKQKYNRISDIRKGIKKTAESKFFTKYTGKLETK